MLVSSPFSHNMASCRMIAPPKMDHDFQHTSSGHVPGLDIVQTLHASMSQSERVTLDASMEPTRRTQGSAVSRFRP